VHPTDEELADLGAACNKLWELDVNRLAPGEDYRINLQRGKTPYQPGDSAPGPLFEYVSPAVFRKPTYAAFVALLNNYERATGVAEAVTEEEKHENRSFLELCMVRIHAALRLFSGVRCAHQLWFSLLLLQDTAVMQYVHQYLVRKGKMPASPEQFLQRLNELWFTLYRREAEGDSSGTRALLELICPKLRCAVDAHQHVELGLHRI
jgi:poly(U)-specific endoribonuclease